MGGPFSFSSLPCCPSPSPSFPCISTLPNSRYTRCNSGTREHVRATYSAHTLRLVFFSLLLVPHPCSLSSSSPAPFFSCTPQQYFMELDAPTRKVNETKRRPPENPPRFFPWCSALLPLPVPVGAKCQTERPRAKSLLNCGDGNRKAAVKIEGRKALPGSSSFFPSSCFLVHYLVPAKRQADKRLASSVETHRRRKHNYGGSQPTLPFPPLSLSPSRISGFLLNPSPPSCVARTENVAIQGAEKQTGGIQQVERAPWENHDPLPKIEEATRS